MGKKEALRTNGARAVSTSKTLAISSIKSLGQVSIVALLAYSAGLFTANGLTNMVNTGISLPNNAYKAYLLLLLVIGSFPWSRYFINKAIEAKVGSKKGWNLAHGGFIVAMLATASWLLGENLTAWLIGAAGLWAVIYIRKVWKDSATTPGRESAGLGLEGLEEFIKDESVRQGQRLHAA